jgi:hypothetical protein
MSTLLVHTQDADQLKATKAFLKALKIPFEKINDESTYNPEFAAKIEKNMQQADEGKVVKIDLDAAEKLSRKEKEFLKGLDEAVEFVNLHQKGKVKAKTIDQFLNEL